MKLSYSTKYLYGIYRCFPSIRYPPRPDPVKGSLIKYESSLETSTTSLHWNENFSNSKYTFYIAILERIIS